MRICTMQEESLKRIFFLAGIFQAIVFHQGALCLDCYACGLAMVDPSVEKFQYSLDPDDKEAKMYNETCSLFDTFLVEFPTSMSKWVRPCPQNVISCFWAKGTYNGETPEFRGCADAAYLHENKCNRELQAVTVVENQKYVDVEVDLCYCDKALCNQQRSGVSGKWKFFTSEVAIAFAFSYSQLLLPLQLG